jgi:nucleosome binding factor SPN SPT16 subunit
MDGLTPGAKISSAYTACRAVFEAEGKDASWLSTHLPESFGFGIGLKHRDALFEITADNDLVIEEGNSFFAQLYIKGLKKGDKEYALYLGDSVIAKDSPQVVTSNITKDYKDISYTLDDSEEEEEEEKEAYINDKNVIMEKRTRGRGMQMDES